MNAGGADGVPPAVGEAPTGSALLGMLLALALVVAGVVLSYGAMLAIDAVLPETMETTAEQAPRDPTATHEDDVAVPSHMEEGLFEDRYLEIALIVLLSPLVLLGLAARSLQRRGRMRTVKGYWIGAIGGMTMLGLLVAVLFYGLAFMTIG